MGLYMYVSIVKTMNWKFVFLPIFRADDEIVDPKKYLEDRCQPKCVKALFEYQVCLHHELCFCVVKFVLVAILTIVVNSSFSFFHCKI